MATASSLVPNTRENCLSQAVWYSSAARPERKKQATTPANVSQEGRSIGRMGDGAGGGSAARRFLEAGAPPRRFPVLAAALLRLAAFRRFRLLRGANVEGPSNPTSYDVRVPHFGLPYGQHTTPNRNELWRTDPETYALIWNAWHDPDGFCEEQSGARYLPSRRAAKLCGAAGLAASASVVPDLEPRLDVTSGGELQAHPQRLLATLSGLRGDERHPQRTASSKLPVPPVRTDSTLPPP